jgi:hypothetical protein
MLGISNAIKGILPLQILCEPADVGTTTESSNFGTPTLFIYDLYPGGLGFARKCYDLVEEILQEALKLIEECPCSYGCPSCVGSPEPPGTRQEPGPMKPLPDREAALCLLHDLLQLEPFVPSLGEYIPAQMREEIKRMEGGSGVSPDGRPGVSPGELTGQRPVLPVNITSLPVHIAEKIRTQLREATKKRAKSASPLTPSPGRRGGK